MPRAPKYEDSPVINFLGLTQHTWKVVCGQQKPHDWNHAQPIGPLVTLQDFLVDILTFTVTLYAACYVCETVGYRMGMRLGLSRGKADRFAGSFVELIYYTVSLTLGYIVFGGEGWFWPSGWDRNMSDGRVQRIPGTKPYTLPADAKFAYLLETAWVLGGFVRLVSRKPKKDFNEMLFHHVVTYTLLMLSYQIGFCRIGAVVYNLHNTFDPFLHLAKCTHYIKLPVLPDVSFVLCALVFAVTRLWYYPIAISYAWVGVCPEIHDTCAGGPWGKTPVEFLEIFALGALLPIHCLWFYMILRVMHKSLVSSGVQGDVRSDSEDDDEEEKKAK